MQNTQTAPPPDALRKRLQDHVATKAISLNKIARSVGYSPSSISQYLSSTYKGDLVKIESNILNYLEREAEKFSSRSVSLNFATVSTARTVFKAARTCHLNSVMGMVYGDSGLGKTTAAVEYAHRYKDTIYILANRSYTPKVLFKKLHLICGMDGKGYINEMFDDVTERLRDSGRLLIIDQAEYLNNTALHLIRTLFDESRIGILLLGLDELFYNVRGQRGEFAQIFTRITIPVKLKPWRRDDVEMVVSPIFKDKALIPVLHNLSRGNGMMLRNLIFNSVQFGNANGDITVEIVNEAAKMLIN